MRSRSGGWVANAEDRPEVKNRWPASVAWAACILLSLIEPILMSASPMLDGSRVYCTALASARYSRWRFTAAWTSRANSVPTAPMMSSPKPSAAIAAALLSLLSRRRGAQNIHSSRSRPSTVSTEMPKTQPMMRVFTLMSPLAMWLNSWAITPCSSRRVKWSSAPLVTPMAALSAVQPAANALMPGSLSSTNTSGTGSPEAIAISSTTLASCFSDGSRVLKSIWRPPIDCAT